MRKLSCVHSTTYTGIKHPLRNLQSRKCFELVAHASQDNTATSAGAATNQHAFSMPRVPAVLYVAKSSFMGVAYLGCTIGAGHMRVSDQASPTYGPASSRPDCGHRIPIDQQVVAKAILGGLHHEYSLERRAA